LILIDSGCAIALIAECLNKARVKKAAKACLSHNNDVCYKIGYEISTDLEEVLAVLFPVLIATSLY